MIYFCCATALAGMLYFTVVKPDLLCVATIGLAGIVAILAAIAEDIEAVRRKM